MAMMTLSQMGGGQKSKVPRAGGPQAPGARGVGARVPGGMRPQQGMGGGKMSPTLGQLAQPGSSLARMLQKRMGGGGMAMGGGFQAPGGNRMARLQANRAGKNAAGDMSTPWLDRRINAMGGGGFKGMAGGAGLQSSVPPGFQPPQRFGNPGGFNPGAGPGFSPAFDGEGARGNYPGPFRAPVPREMFPNDQGGGGFGFNPNEMESAGPDTLY